MAAPVVVALTNDYVEAARQAFLVRDLGAFTADQVRAALEAAAVATEQAEQPDLFGSTP